MKRVYICAPLSDNPNQDVIEAVRFGEYAMKECGAAPVVPHFHILMVNPKNDKETEQRKLANFSFLWMVDELWVFGDSWTDEMMEEISRAEMLKIPIRYHSDNKVILKSPALIHAKGLMIIKTLCLIDWLMSRIQVLGNVLKKILIILITFKLKCQQLDNS